MTAKMIIEHPTCSECRWWDRIQDTASGYCKEGPPTGPTRWPFTQDNEWCGRWAKIPVPPKAKATPE